jgi:hypothetical protein
MTNEIILPNNIASMSIREKLMVDPNTITYTSMGLTSIGTVSIISGIPMLSTSILALSTLPLLIGVIRNKAYERKVAANLHIIKTAIIQKMNTVIPDNKLETLYSTKKAQWETENGKIVQARYKKEGKFKVLTLTEIDQ